MFAASIILGRWPELSLVAIIDILIVACLIYEFLLLIKGTRAAPMLAGVAVLGIAVWVARLAELRTVIVVRH